MNVNLREGIDKFRLGPYAIDLKKLEQANTKSGYKRKIVQQKDINHVEQAYWLVKRTENPNDLYEYELQTAIETSYELWIESKKDAKNEEFVFSIEDNNYSINFSLMTQTNLESKFSRTVRRIVIWVRLTVYKLYYNTAKLWSDLILTSLLSIKWTIH